MRNYIMNYDIERVILKSISQISKSINFQNKNLIFKCPLKIMIDPERYACPESEDMRGKKLQKFSLDAPKVNFLVA